MASFSSVVVENVTDIKGIDFPSDVQFNDIIVTGPPGSGKTSLIQSIGGWPIEGYINLARKNWWRDPVLAYRPREIHFGFPFDGHAQSRAVFDPEWVSSPSKVDLERIYIPPEHHGRILSRNWHDRYVFYFLLPRAEQLYAIRTRRAWVESHPVDEYLSEELVKKQLEAYETIALHFHRCGLRVYVQQEYSGQPLRITEKQASHGVRYPAHQPKIQSEVAQVWTMFK